VESPVNDALAYALGILTGIALSAVVAVGTLVVGSRELTSDLCGAPTVVEAPPDDLLGTYDCGTCIYRAVEFRDGNHSVIYGMGIAIPTTFARVGDRVYVSTQQGDLGFRVVDATTLEGEGWADGTYHRR
jgi:hypothetical protein